ncbi:MAG: GxxExxY protein [Anaerolineales bacterium]|nr:GxxExxY protein [Anaerolineales bacterium]
MGKLLYEDLTYRIRAVLFEVYNTLGPGFREETYKIATLAEMRRRGIKAIREIEIEIKFKGEIIDKYRLDIVVEDKVILELKAADELHPPPPRPTVFVLEGFRVAAGSVSQFWL